MVFRFCGFGKTFHESENPVSLFETGRLIRFFGWPSLRPVTPLVNQPHSGWKRLAPFGTTGVARRYCLCLSRVSRRFWLNRDRATQCVRGRLLPLPRAGVLWQQSSPEPADGAVDSGLRCRWVPCFSCLKQSDECVDLGDALGQVTHLIQAVAGFRSVQFSTD